MHYCQRGDELKNPVQTSPPARDQDISLNPAAGPIDWLVAARLHHWVKNILVFLPLALTPQLLSVQSVIQCVLGFLALSITCSGTYLFNDILDRVADRQHRSKFRRPVAANQISVSSALIVGMGMCVIGLLSAVAINIVFAALLAAYIIVSIAYSYYLKTLVLLDLATLAGMFTMRIVMGAVLIGGVITPWLPVFVFLFFGGLSTAKRTAELVGRTRRGDHSNNRRGYLEEDLALLIAVGVTFSIGALILLSIFLSMVAVPEMLYQSPLRLWVAVPLLLIWTLRIWIFAVRGALPDDPVLFSLRDPLSLSIGTLLGFAILGAHLP